MIGRQVVWRRNEVTLGQTQTYFASTYWQRLRGLLGRPAPLAGTALCIQPCSSVHTFFMGYALDVVYVSRNGRVVKVISGLNPWRVSQCFGAKKAFEFRAGEVKNLGLQVGDLCVDGL